MSRNDPPPGPDTFRVHLDPQAAKGDVLKPLVKLLRRVAERLRDKHERASSPVSDETKPGM